jgi:hypothetical protein
MVCVSEAAVALSLAGCEESTQKPQLDYRKPAAVNRI